MTKNTKILLSIVLLIALAGLSYTYLHAPAGNAGSAKNSSMPPVTDNDWAQRAPGSQVTVVEYADYQCPACAAYHPLVETLKNDYKGRVTFVFRLFPLPMHLNAVPAGIAAEAAGMQGKYFEMADKLFTNQQDWESSNTPEDTFVKYASEIGLDAEKFKTDFASDTLRQKVVAYFKAGSQAKVTSTPTFFINGVKIKNPSGNTNNDVLTGFRALIDAELAKTNSAITVTSTTTSSTTKQ